MAATDQRSEDVQVREGRWGRWEIRRTADHQWTVTLRQRLNGQRLVSTHNSDSEAHAAIDAMEADKQ